jgi:hypothetical protein
MVDWPVHSNFREPTLRGGILGSAVCVTLLAGCGSGLMKPMKTVEQRNDRIPGNKFQTIAVIAGDETRPGLRLSVQVREQMNKQGITAVRKAGRWGSQLEAFNDICRPDQEEPVKGVLIVTYDRLVLHDCDTKGVAYSIIGGAALGLTQMTDKLVAYIKS